MLSSILVLFLWMFSTYFCSAITNDMNKAIHSIKLYPNMQMSMDLWFTSIPSSSTTVLLMDSSLDSFLSMFILSPNILQIQIQNHFTKQHVIYLNTSYSFNITLNPSNNHYTFHASSSARTETFHFTLYSSQIQYASDYSLAINNDDAQITNFRITTLELNDYNVLAVDKASNSSTTAPPRDTSYESVFGPNITKQQELIIVIAVAAVVFCVVLFISIAMIRKCVKRNRQSTEHEQSYEYVNGTTPVGVHYLDETPGDHDIIHTPFKVVNVNDAAVKDAVTTTVTVTTALTEQTTEGHEVHDVHDVHEDSIDAMDL